MARMCADQRAYSNIAVRRWVDVGQRERSAPNAVCIRHDQYAPRMRKPVAKPSCRSARHPRTVDHARAIASPTGYAPRSPPTDGALKRLPTSSTR